MRPTGGSRWDMAGKVISFDHVWVTQSTSYLAWKPGMVSGKRVPGGTQLHSVTSVVHAQLGIVWAWRVAKVVSICTCYVR